MLKRKRFLFAVMAIIINFHMMKCTIEIPLGALSHDFVGEGDEAAKIALHTLTPASVRYLSESLSEVC